MKRLSQTISSLTLLLLVISLVHLLNESLDNTKPAFAAAGDPISVEKILDNANSSYFLDPAATGTSLSLAGNIQLSEGASPSTPSDGKLLLYAKTDNSLYIKDDVGTETKLAGAEAASGINIVLRAKYETNGSGIGSVNWLFDHQGGPIAVGWCNSGDHYFYSNKGDSVTFAGINLTLLKSVTFNSGNSDDRPRTCEWWYNENIAAQHQSFVVNFKNAHVAEFWAQGFTLENVMAVGNTGGGTRNDDSGAGNLSYSISGQKEGNLVLSVVTNQKANWSETSGATLIEKDGNMGSGSGDAGLYSRSGTGDQWFTYNYDAGPEAASAAVEFVP